MDIAAAASFLTLVAAWLVLPLRTPAALAAEREPAAMEVQTVASAAA